jgi:Ca2+-dependent lipid-binding protein
LTSFKKDKYDVFSDIVFLFTKDVGKNGDTMVYKITENEIKKNENCEVKYETFHTDDFIQLELFHKNSIQKNSKLGKAFINIRDLNCKTFIEDEEDTGTCYIVPISFMPSNYG